MGNCLRGFERECTALFARVVSFGVIIGIFGASILLVLPYAWANPYDGKNDGGCEAEYTIAIAVGFPCVMCGATVCFCASFVSGTMEELHKAVSCALCTLLVLACVAAVLVANARDCEHDSKDFAMSVGLMFGIPVWLFLFFSITALGCAVCSSECDRMPSRLTRQQNTAIPINIHQQTPHRPGGQVTAAPSSPPKQRIRRAQQILRNAMIYGDSHLVNLLLDVDSRQGNPLWRCYRCLVLSTLHCQCRPACCRPPESGSERALHSAAARASLSYAYTDGDGERPIHYLARGTKQGHAAETVGHEENGWCCVRRRSLPELTDCARAEVLRQLLQSNHLALDDLAIPNTQGHTALHCAVFSGSRMVIEEICKSTSYDIGFLNLPDRFGNTPCDLALQLGRIDCARMVGGTPSEWSGVSRMGAERRAVQECLSEALTRLPADVPKYHEFDSAATTSTHSLKAHRSSEDVLSHLDSLLHDLHTRTGRSLPFEATDALLRYFNFDVDAAVAAFDHNPRTTLDAAGLKRISCSSSSHVQPSLLGRERSTNQCMVCFDNVKPPSVCTSLPCKHCCCDDCLQTHVDVRLRDGDVAGIICPDPDCKVPISESMVKELFGESAPHTEKLRILLAQKFVDSGSLNAWCPRPGCGKAVSLIAKSITSKWNVATVNCTCGCKFCFECKQIGGHLPVPCKEFKEWTAEVANQRLRDTAESERWVKENTQECTCGAQIQRTSGCNHMTCTICGRHFCYVCKKDWQLHRNQPGGFDYFRCSLQDGAGQATSTRPQNQDKSHLVISALPGWLNNERSAEQYRALSSVLAYLSEKFYVAEEYVAVINEGCDSLLEARTILRNCYVLRYHWTAEEWCRRLEKWVGELEQVCSALEIVFGFRQLDTAIRNCSKFGAGDSLPSSVEDIICHLDMRTIVPRALAASEYSGAITQLSIAVKLQTRRILEAGQLGFPERKRDTLPMMQSLREIALVQNDEQREPLRQRNGTNCVVQ